MLRGCHPPPRFMHGPNTTGSSTDVGRSEGKNVDAGRRCFCNGDAGSAVCNASPRSEVRSKLPGAGRAGSPAPGGHLSVLQEGRASPSAGPCVVLTAAAPPHWGLLLPSSFLISSSSSTVSQEGSCYCLNHRPYNAYISTTWGLSWRLVQIVLSDTLLGFHSPRFPSTIPQKIQKCGR